MAVTSIWRVHGSVGKVLDYVENAEKTTAVSTGDGDLSDVIDYAIQQRKTSRPQVRDGEEVVQRFVSGINCNPRTAKMEMQKIKKFYGKEDGVIAYHGYQSFAPGEATPELAHEIGIKLAQQLWGDRYQVLVATHLDRANHLHSHFVINTVSFVDGIKYHRTKEDYKEMQRASDALCREYGLSVIRNPKGRGKTYSEWAAERDGKPTLRGVIRSDIDRAILASTTQRNFQEAMQAMGYALLFIRGERPVKDLKYNILKHPNVALTTDGQAAAYQHGTDPLSVAAVSINLEKLKQAASEDTGTGDYVVLTEEEVYDFMRRKAQENNQNQNSNHQEETYEKHHQQYHPPHHPSYF